MPSDHYIDDLDKFYNVVEAGFKTAEKYLSLVTLGIKPSRPDTGYGYIEVGNLIDSFEGKNVFEVKRFVEKPTYDKAVEYISSGKFFGTAVCLSGKYQQYWKRYINICLN